MRGVQSGSLLPLIPITLKFIRGLCTYMLDNLAKLYNNRINTLGILSRRVDTYKEGYDAL